MAAITRIDVRIKTGDRSSAGTDSRVYLAICGREFNIDSAVDDFERGSDRTYTLGVGANVNDAANNDPRSPFALDTVDLDHFPAWIRLEPGGSGPNWDLEFVSATVNPGPGQTVFQALGGGNHLWLGDRYGKHVFLKR